MLGQTASSTIIEGPVINAENRLVVFVQRDEERVRWTSVKSALNVELSLVLAHWNPDQELLCINSSKLKDLHLDLAKRIAGYDVEPVNGEPIFRVLYGFRRLVLMNLGLSETRESPSGTLNSWGRTSRIRLRHLRAIAHGRRPICSARATSTLTSLMTPALGRRAPV